MVRSVRGRWAPPFCTPLSGCGGSGRASWSPGLGRTMGGSGGGEKGPRSSRPHRPRMEAGTGRTPTPGPAGTASGPAPRYVTGLGGVSGFGVSGGGLLWVFTLFSKRLNPFPFSFVLRCTKSLPCSERYNFLVGVLWIFDVKNFPLWQICSGNQPKGSFLQ